MGVQQNKIFYLEERSHAASEARWELFANQHERSTEEISDNRLERSKEEISDNRLERGTLATGVHMPVPPIYRRSTKKEKREFYGSVHGVRLPRKGAK